MTREEYIAARDAWEEAQKDPEKARMRRYKKEWYLANKGSYRSKYQKYQLSDHGRKKREAYLAQYRLNPVNRIRAIINAAFNRALHANMEFEQCIKPILEENPPSHCACCSVELDYRIYKKNKLQSPSIDRLDNSKGYIVGNVFIVCFSCNRKKSNLSMKDLDQIAAYMQRYGRF